MHTCVHEYIVPSQYVHMCKGKGGQALTFEGRWIRMRHANTQYACMPIHVYIGSIESQDPQPPTPCTVLSALIALFPEQVQVFLRSATLGSSFMFP